MKEPEKVDEYILKHYPKDNELLKTKIYHGFECRSSAWYKFFAGWLAARDYYLVDHEQQTSEGEGEK